VHDASVSVQEISDRLGVRAPSLQAQRECGGAAHDERGEQDSAAAAFADPQLGRLAAAHDLDGLCQRDVQE
jgi:hypothetical protein